MTIKFGTISSFENTSYEFESIIYCHREYLKIMSEHENGEAHFFYIEDNNNYCFYPFIKRKLPNNIYYDITTAFDYGGYFYDNKQILPLFFKEFKHYCKSNNIISEFIRFLPTHTFDYPLISDFIHVKKINDLIYIDLKIDFWKDYARGRKSNINKIKKMNYRINKISVEQFQILYQDTMHRNNAHQYFFFDSKTLKKLHQLKEVKIYGLYINNKLISGIMILYNGAYAYYYLGGLLSSSLASNANAFLFHKISLLLKEEGIKLFFLGGGRQGVFDFKKRFSKKTLPYYIGYKVHNSKIYNELVTLSDNKDNDFFPKYREKII